jgi:hypothetical protein
MSGFGETDGPRSGNDRIALRSEKTAHFQRIQAPPGQPVQPGATGAGMEATKW